ncbi:unnamed protein product [Effrenium voratum]|uniref:Uncharacterized protein n=1 Tax=Effrenium voratum TaxID=2562239 RepID=A0AA36JDG2_9DINO|nr:unnamed protein product [Effrenium voratum]
MKELVALSKTSGERKESSWVPFNKMMRQYGLQELMRRIHKGTIACRKALHDDDEWEFKLNKATSYEDTSHSHTYEGSKAGKMEACQWLELKAKSIGGTDEGDSAKAAISRNLGKSLTKQLKLKDKNSESLDEDDDESQGTTGQEKEDPEEAEAEILSSSGMAKSETGTRINRMKKLLLKLKKEGSRDQVAILSGPLKELEKFEKKKTSMEAVKGILFDAAVAVKKYKKFRSAQK